MLGLSDTNYTTSGFQSVKSYYHIKLIFQVSQSLYTLPYAERLNRTITHHAWDCDRISSHGSDFIAKKVYSYPARFRRRSNPTLYIIPTQRRRISDPDHHTGSIISQASSKPDRLSPPLANLEPAVEGFVGIEYRQLPAL